MRIALLAAASALLLTACGEPESVVITGDDAESAFDTDDQRILYTIGTQIGMSIEELRITTDELEFIEAGMRDMVSGTPPQVDVNLYGARLQEFVDRRMEQALVAQREELAAEKVAAIEFADAVAEEAGAERSPSGLVYVPVTVGEGEMPEARDTVMVHYTGSLRDGTVFDSSYNRGDEPVPLSLNQVIPCWTEGVQKIQVGGKAKLLCPSDIAYGDGGRPPTIPGGAALLFEIELFEIVE